jgi:acetyltransferase-like isoleucine patch superfamily enzyme
VPTPSGPRPTVLRQRALDTATTVVQRMWGVAKRHGTVTPGHPLARRFGSMGEGSWVSFPPGDYVNLHAVHLGRNVVIGADVTLAVGMPTEQYPADCEPVISFGDRTTVGKGCWFVARQRVLLEDDVTLAPNVYITDHNHTYADPWLPVGQQILQCDPVRIGSGTWIGTNVVVLPGADVGRNCAIAAGTVVRGTIPDHSVVAGVPGKVVRRWTEAEGWQPPMARPVEVLPGWPVGVPPADRTPEAPDPEA